MSAYVARKMDDGQWRVIHKASGREVKKYRGKDAQQQATRKAARLNVIERKGR